jgi:serine O-acetyltransferase/putative colanic acid biosynthesis acetyltransferase WcaB
MTEDVLVDWAVNAGNVRARLLLVGFRLTRRLRTSPRYAVRMAGRFSDAAYRFLSTWLLGVELPWLTEVGPRLRLHHPHGIVVNAGARLGADVAVRHGVTIGSRRGDFDCPVIGDGVDIGAGAAVVGAITVGDGARIGIGAVVLKDVPPGASAYGNPARVAEAPGTPAG